MEALSDISNWIVVGVTTLVIAIAISLHYEVLRGCVDLLPHATRRRRRRVVILILIILATHSCEVWIFAFAYHWLLDFERFGSLTGTDVTGLLDYVYYSGMVYTTVGFGDLYPTGPIRFMTGMEALTGLVLITWSASFTFLEMQRYWPEHRHTHRTHAEASSAGLVDAGPAKQPGAPAESAAKEAARSDTAARENAPGEGAPRENAPRENV